MLTDSREGAPEANKSYTHRPVINPQKPTPMRKSNVTSRSEATKGITRSDRGTALRKRTRSHRNVQTGAYNNELNTKNEIRAAPADCAHTWTAGTFFSVDQRHRMSATLSRFIRSTKLMRLRVRGKAR